MLVDPILVTLIIQYCHLHLELEQVPDPARRPGPDEKLSVNKPNTRYYSGSNLDKSVSFLANTYNIEHTRLELSQRGPIGSS